MKSNALLSELSERTHQLLNDAATLLQVPDNLLQERPSAGRWNVLECLEHLNLYGDFYLPEIRRRIVESSFPPGEYFNSGWLGDYFVKSMEPGKTMKKMKTFKDKDPIKQVLNRDCIDRFIEQQREILTLVEMAKSVDLSRTKTGISISRLLKLKLGDTFRFLIAHNIRHMCQAFACLPNTSKKQVVKIV